MLFRSGPPPLLLQYNGRGPLAAWVRAAATRLALNAITRESKEQPTELSFFYALVASDTLANALPPSAHHPAAHQPEAHYLKHSSRAALQAAFERAAASLDARERNLLKFVWIEKLNVDQVAAVFMVHRATAARWVAAAREHLVRRTHAELVVGLRVNHEEAASIIREGLSGIGFTFLGADEPKL